MMKFRLKKKSIKLKPTGEKIFAPIFSEELKKIYILHLVNKKLSTVRNFIKLFQWTN